MPTGMTDFVKLREITQASQQLQLGIDVCSIIRVILACPMIPTGDF